MKIYYQETTNDLARRIDIHNQFGSLNIDEWMLDLLKLKKGESILDVGCGAGKQCLSYYHTLNGDCDITGGDVSGDLLNKARQESTAQHAAINFIDLDFNKRFPFNEQQFDLVSCCFAIYYALDVPFTISEMHRVLKDSGRLFTSGPMPENKRLFYDIISEATNNRPFPTMPGSSRYSSEFLSTIQTIFSKVEVHIFNNPLTFKSVQPFIDYTRASLNEDRKIWSSFFKDKNEFEQIMENISKAAQRRLDRDGELVMTKVVGGFVATR